MNWDTKGSFSTKPEDNNGSVPDWVKNLFKDLSSGPNKGEIQEAYDWARDIIDEVERKKHRDPYWIEFPLIQREARLLEGEHLKIYGYIRENPTYDLNNLFIKSGCEENKFFKIVEDLIRYNYLRIFFVYNSLEYSYQKSIPPYLKMKTPPILARE